MVFSSYSPVVKKGAFIQTPFPSVLRSILFFLFQCHTGNADVYIGNFQTSHIFNGCFTFSCTFYRFPEYCIHIPDSGSDSRIPRSPEHLTFTPLDRFFIPSFPTSSLVIFPAIEATPSTSVAARPAIIATTSSAILYFSNSLIVIYGIRITHIFFIICHFKPSL